MKKAGYHTGLVGKWHLKSQPQSFDYYSVFHDQDIQYADLIKKMKQEMFRLRQEVGDTDVDSERMLEIMRLEKLIE